VARYAAHLRRAGPAAGRPDPFPQHSLLATRIALVLEDEVRPAFSRAVYHAEFGEGRPIAEPTTLAPLLEGLGLDAEDVFARAQSPENKERLKRQCADAAEIGLLGAPSLVTADGEIFWGNDRLENGLEWVGQ
jgi:2-hydroxychromene-2-carboxylate isomerase